MVSVHNKRTHRIVQKLLPGAAFFAILMTQVVMPYQSLYALQTSLPFDMVDYSVDYKISDTRLSTITPEIQPVSDALGRLDPNTVRSYQVTETNNNMTFCSLVTYNNLKKITDSTDIARGDAIVIWNTTKSTIYTGSFVDALQRRYYDTRQTVYDVVTFRPIAGAEKDTTSDSYLLQSHRFVVFLGTDDQRYVADSTRIKKSESILLETYMSVYRYPGELLKIVASYIPVSQGKTAQQSVEVYSPMELFSYAQQGMIETQDTKDNSHKTLFRQSLKYRDTNHTFSAQLPEGLEVQSADGGKPDLSSFAVKTFPVRQTMLKMPVTKESKIQGTLPATLIVDGKKTVVPMVVSPTTNLPLSINPKKSPSGLVATSQSEQVVNVVQHEFQFGIEGQHLLFSQPVQITQQVDLLDGSIMSVGVKHGNETVFGTGGLSVDPDTLCVNGEATIPGSEARVQNGQVVFWTCGASTFSLTYTGGASAAYFVDNGFQDFSLSFATGVQFPTGTTISDVNVAINWMPVDNEVPTGPWGTTDCFPGEKSFQLYHPDGTIVNLINAGQLTTPSTSCPQVLTTFDDQASTAITTTYATGTYKPTAGQLLSSFNNKSPFGSWKLRMTDNTASDGVILFGFTITIGTNPDITNNSGNDIGISYIEQSSTPVIDIVTSDPNHTEGSGLTYTLSGLDAAKFAINANGIVTWLTQPTYDNPTDNATNNIYDLQIIVTNTIGNTDSINLAITILRAPGQFCKSTVDLSDFNTCLTTTGSTVRCRGVNTNAQVADGTTNQRLVPTNSTLFGSSIRQVDSSSLSTFAVTTTGIILAIGSNTLGKLGDGTTTNRTTPVLVSGINNALRVYGQGVHTCSLLNNYTAKCRGSNGNGQLGNGTTTNSFVPVVVTGLSLITDMALGSNFTCALTSANRVYCRGANTNGRLGDGTTTQRLLPTLVSSITGVNQIAAGQNHACALRTGGTVYCWGLNTNGQLGDGTTTQKLVPTLVGGLTGVVSIAASRSSTCALRNDGTLRCWGLNTNGQLGDNTTTQRLVPTPVVNMNWIANQVFASASSSTHFCASSMSGNLYCRGSNGNGQLGDNTTTTRRVPTLVSGGNLFNPNSTCNTNTAPIIQNNSGAAIAMGYTENSSIPVIDISTNDDVNSEGSGLTYSLTGADKLLFSVTSAGIISWLTSPDYETPGDVGGNNIYNITLVVTDAGGLLDTIDVAITVSDVYEGTITPGCINREPRAWYKADDGAYNGTTWQDQTANARHVDSNGTFFNNPSASLVNFNPSYQFDSTNYFYVKSPSFIHDGTRGSMWYTVASYPEVFAPESYLINLTMSVGSTENSALLADNNLGRYHTYDRDNSSTMRDAYGSSPTNPSRRLLTTQRYKDDIALSEDGVELTRQTLGIVPSTYDFLSIGMQYDSTNNWVNPWVGQVPEVILYNDPNSDINTYNMNGNDDERIQTYLAIKYGQTLRHNYIDALGNVIYDINALYNNNIVGIGRQDCEALYQKQSKSESPDSLISIGVGNSIAPSNVDNTGTIANDSSYLILGDNAAPILPRTTIGAPTGHAMSQRIRTSQNTNFSNTVTISAPAHTSPLSVKLPAPTTGVVKLMIDPDGNFTDGNTVFYPMTLLGTDRVVTGVTINNNEYLGFATAQPAPSGSLCIESPAVIFTGFVVKNVSQTIDVQSDYFKVLDNRGADSGYYTTISLSALTGSFSGTILPSSVLWKADPITTLSGSVNPLVTLGPGMGSYVSASSTTQLINRNTAPNGGLTGNYATKLSLKFSIPAYKAIDTYSGSITYTLYEN